MRGKQPSAKGTKNPGTGEEKPNDMKGNMKHIGGSLSDHWNNILGNQALRTLWLANSNEETKNSQLKATIAALVGLRPRDELEAMIGAQLLRIPTIAAG